MFRPVALRTLPLSLALASLFTLPACQQFSQLKFQNQGADQATAARGDASADAASSPAPPPAQTAEEIAFYEKCTSLGATGTTIEGRDGWFFSPTELQRLAKLQDPASSSIRTATAAITNYRDQLKRHGVELIFVPVPPKAVIFPDKLAKDLKIKVKGRKPVRPDSALQTVYANLRAKGIRVIDVTDALLATREDKKLGPVFPKTAAVWSPRGAETAARTIAAELKGASWANQPGKDGPLITEAASLSYLGPLTTGSAVAESLAIRNIGRTTEGKMRSVTFSQGGHPLALLGDQTLLSWREANNPTGSSGAFASLADQLAYELQTTPDLFPGNTDGRNAARLRILREGTNGRNPLGSAKTVLWVVQSTDLALSDWKQIPLRLEFNLTQPELQLTTPGAATPVLNPAPPSDSPSGSPPSSDVPPVPELPR